MKPTKKKYQTIPHPYVKRDGSIGLKPVAVYESRTIFKIGEYGLHISYPKKIRT